jgi:hypothetical protein
MADAMRTSAATLVEAGIQDAAEPDGRSALCQLRAFGGASGEDVR